MTDKSIWLTDTPRSRFPKLPRNLRVDVVVVGAGIMGVTAAYLLKQAGRTVALLERDRWGQHDTGNTTAHLTQVTDTRLSQLVKVFGRDHAQATWDAGCAAIGLIEDNVQRENIACDFRRVPGFLHAPLEQGTAADAGEFKNEARLASELGFEAAYVDSVPLVHRPGIRFANQAQFHPLKYLAGLLGFIPGKGSHVFEHSEATEFADQPLSVKANGHTVECKYVIIATHVPLLGKNSLVSGTLFQSKLAPYSSYAVGARLPNNSLPDACFWDTADPYYYLRTYNHSGYDYAIFGGEDHKTGQVTDTAQIYQKLESKLYSFLPKAKVDHRWSGQVVETNDGLPLIGELSDRQFIATGFSGNGMTFGTLSAMMACDAVTGRKNPWKELFDVHRKTIIGGTWDYVKENIDYPYYMLKDRLAAAEGKLLRNVKRGEGKILKLHGKRVAAYRNDKGQVTTLSCICTHLGCVVHWNNSEKTWDCPCHGSRFKATGAVIAGPAETQLEKINKSKK